MTTNAKATNEIEMYIQKKIPGQCAGMWEMCREEYAAILKLIPKDDMKSWYAVGIHQNVKWVIDALHNANDAEHSTLTAPILMSMVAFHDPYTIAFIKMPNKTNTGQKMRIGHMLDVTEQILKECKLWYLVGVRW
jgi:hypothetical protein